MFRKKSSKPRPSRAKKPAAGPVIHEEPSRTIYIPETDIPAFKEILDIASKGIPSTRVAVLVGRLKKAVE